MGEGHQQAAVSAQPEILIIGAGPAGLTAGIYASRAGHPTLILEKELVGGQVARTAIVENYPGFREPIEAMTLVEEMEEQARRFGCEFATDEVKGLTAVAGAGVTTITVTTVQGVRTPKALIIATGTTPRRLGVEGEERFVGRGVSYCAICDGPLFRGKEVAVVGGGDSALEEADYLTRFCSRVFLIHRRDEFRAARVAQERVRRNEKITLLLSRVVTRIEGKNRLEEVEIKDLKSGKTERLPVAGLFVYVGLLPNTGFCQGVVELDEAGFVKTDPEMRTNVPGVFAAGDVRQKRVRQIATAVGDGAIAAMMAHEYIETVR